MQRRLDTVDVIIEYDDGEKEGVVLITRKYDPFAGKLAVPGGFIDADEHGKYTPAEAALCAAVREMQEETSLDVSIEAGPWVFDAPGRDPRGEVASGLYIARGCGSLKADDDAKDAHTYSPAELVGMLGQDLFAFDHEEMIRTYLEYRGHL